MVLNLPNAATSDTIPSVLREVLLILPTSKLLGSRDLDLYPSALSQSMALGLCLLHFIQWPHSAPSSSCPRGLGRRTYLSILGAVGLWLGQSTGRRGLKKLSPSDEQVSNRWITGPSGAGLLGTQEARQG